MSRVACLLLCVALSCVSRPQPASLERVVISGQKLLFEHSKKAFVPWGVNYGNSGRLMEDFWQEDWETVAEDFHEIKALGANVVRVHLQFGKFMKGPREPNEAAFGLLRRCLRWLNRRGFIWISPAWRVTGRRTGPNGTMRWMIRGGGRRKQISGEHWPGPVPGVEPCSAMIS